MACDILAAADASVPLRSLLAFRLPKRGTAIRHSARLAITATQEEVLYAIVNCVGVDWFIRNITDRTRNFLLHRYGITKEMLGLFFKNRARRPRMAIEESPIEESPFEALGMAADDAAAAAEAVALSPEGVLLTSQAPAAAVIYGTGQAAGAGATGATAAGAARAVDLSGAVRATCAHGVAGDAASACMHKLDLPGSGCGLPVCSAGHSISTGEYLVDDGWPGGGSNAPIGGYGCCCCCCEVQGCEVVLDGAGSGALSAVGSCGGFGLAKAPAAASMGCPGQAQMAMTGLIVNGYSHWPEAGLGPHFGSRKRSRQMSNV